MIKEKEKKSEPAMILLRVTPEFRDTLRDIAVREKRSLNKEIIYALEKHVQCKTGGSGIEESSNDN